MKKYLFLILIGFALTSCISHKFIYTPPKEVKKVESNIILNEPKKVVWNKLIKGVGANFFVINNLDKESGFMNISYSGTPEDYIDAGQLHFYFSNARGPRDYIFPASKSQAQYETWLNGTLCIINRKLDLDGRININVNEIDSLQTMVSVNVKYIITMNSTGEDISGKTLMPYSEIISFNTGGNATSSGGTIFYPNGKLEKCILDMVRPIELIQKDSTNFIKNKPAGRVN
ncbi:MAG: hypothetical protein V1773_04500 [bacterium]